MLSLNTNWLAAFRAADVRAVYLVSIFTNTGATCSMVSGDQPLFGYPCSVSDVRTLAFELDPLARSYRIATVEVEVADDGELRDFITANRAWGQRVRIYLGTQGLAEADFEQIGTYAVEDWRPGEGVIHLSSADAASVLRSRLIGRNGIWVAMHPLSVALSLMQLGGHPASLIDSTTFDHSDAAYEAISHWNISRGHTVDPMFPSNTITDPRPSTELLQDLLQVLDGWVGPNEEGVHEAHVYDSTDATVAEWTADDIGALDVASTTDNLRNQLVVRLGIRDTAVGEDSSVYQASDTASQAALAFPGVAERIVDEKIESRWLNGVGYMFDPIDENDTTMDVRSAIINGFCGTRVVTDLPWATYSLTLDDYQAPEDQLDGTTRVAWLLLEGQAVDPGTGLGVLAREIVKATAFEVGPGGPPIQCADGAYRPQHARFTIVRAQLGTTAYSWTANYTPPDPLNPPAFTPRVFVKVTDITIPVAMAQARLARFAHGAAVIDVATTLEQFGVQVGDFVTFVDPTYLHKNADGATSATIWQVVRKEILALDDVPRIDWRLLWVRHDTYPYTPTVAFTAPEAQVQLLSGTVADIVTDEDGKIVVDDYGEIVIGG